MLKLFKFTSFSLHLLRKIGQVSSEFTLFLIDSSAFFISFSDWIIAFFGSVENLIQINLKWLSLNGFIWQMVAIKYFTYGFVLCINLIKSFFEGVHSLLTTLVLVNLSQKNAIFVHDVFPVVCLLLQVIFDLIGFLHTADFVFHHLNGCFCKRMSTKEQNLPRA